MLPCAGSAYRSMQHYFASALCLFSVAAVSIAAELPHVRAGAAVLEQRISFEHVPANNGLPSHIRARNPRWMFSSTGSETHLRLGGAFVRFALEDGSRRPALRRLEASGQVSQYFLGRAGLSRGRISPHFRRMRFDGVYEGVDLEFYGRGGDIEYDFYLSAGARPQTIVLAFGSPVDIRADGSLAIQAGEAELIQHAPMAFQGGRLVEVRYRSLGERRIGFDIGEYDPDQPLRIDPRIGLASFFGASGSDRIDDIAFDSRGAMWITGRTNSPDFPLPPSGFPSPRRGVSDVFASKLERASDAAGNESWRLVTTLFLGGAGRDRAAGIRVDPGGRVYIFGDTQSEDFPVSSSATQDGLAGDSDAFLTVLRESDFPFFALRDEAGREAAQTAFTNYEIEYSTLFGGSGDEIASEGAVSSFTEDPGQPCAILAGHSNSSDLLTTTFSIQEDSGGGADAFFSVFCREGPAQYPLTYGTYLGGNREEFGAAVDVAADGSFCIATRTTSSGLASSGWQRTLTGSTEVYLACHAPIRRRSGLPFLYRELGSTFWGGSAAESLIDIEIEDMGEGPEPFRVHVLAESVSQGLTQPFPAPALPPGTQAANPGTRSLLVGAFPSTLDRPLTQFWVGGSSQESGAGLVLSGGCLAVAGATDSADFPSIAGFPERRFNAGFDVAAGKFCFGPQMSAPTTVYLGAYGSSGADAASAIAAGAFDDEYVAGWTTAASGVTPELDTTASAPQSAYGGGQEEGLLVELYRPRLRPEAVVGAADFVARPIAPGQLVTLFGLGFGPGAVIGPRLDEAGRVRTELAGVRVLFDGQPAPMIFVSRNQLSAVAPFFLDVRSSVQVQVETDGARSAPVTLPVAPTAPAVFTLSQTGSGQAAVLNEDSSVNGSARPAAPGSLLQIFLTGAGQTQPRGVDGELIPARQPFPQIVAPVVVRIGGSEATVLYAGGAPGQVHGVAQINVLTPRALGSNPETPLEISIGGQSIQSGVTVAIAGAP